MSQQDFLLHKGLREPKAAAIAGILFGVLLITSEVLFWISIPSNLGGPALDVINHSKTIGLALTAAVRRYCISVVHCRLAARRVREDSLDAIRGSSRFPTRGIVELTSLRGRFAFRRFAIT